MDNFTQITDSGNPWNNQDKSLTGLKWALLLGERTGHISRTDYEDELDSEEESKLPSIKMMKLLNKMIKAREDLNKINLEIQCRMQDKETRDITHLDILEQRIGKIKKLSSHLESVIESKDQLILRLQQPFQGDNIKLEAQYHKFASEIFPQITPLLAELMTNLENIIWARSLSLTDARFDSIISELSTILNAMQTSFQSYCEIQQSLDQLHNHRVRTLHSTHIDHL